MSKEFPHLRGANDSVYGYGRETFQQITGQFDYSKWTEGATLTLMSVPWGVYDASVMTDRPAFDTAAERDSWFAAHIADATNTTESHVLDTLVRYQMRDYADLPFTFDYTSLYNYLIVDYPNAPVSGGTKGIKRWFFHITGIDYSSPSTTRVTLVPDWWVTVAPLLDISHMILERGHAPVAKTNAKTFLANPRENSKYLLAPDVDFGTNTIVASQNNDVINNGTVYAVICTKGIQLAEVSASHYDTLPFGRNFVDGLPSAYQVAVNATNLNTFLNNWQSQAPQTMQALECIYLVSSKLINIGAEFSLFGVSAYYMSSKHYTSETELNLNSFGYDDKIAHLAKLYTSPYAHVEVSDSEGNTATINIEDLSSSKVSIECALNGAFPWLNITTHILNNGGNNRTLTFRTTQAHEFSAGGKWWDTLNTWGVPCFSIYQPNASVNDYRHYWTRQQQTLAANNSYISSTESNKYAYDNAIASNATAKTNTDNSADTAVSNNAVVVAAATATTARTVSANNQVSYAQIVKLDADWSADFNTSSAALEAEQNAVALAASNNQAAGTVSAVTQGLTAVSNITTGNLAGAASNIASMVSTGVQMQNAAASYAMSQSNNSSLYAAATSASTTKQSAANVYNTSTTGYSNSALTENTATNNNASTSTTANNASLMKTNSANTKQTGDANAARTKAVSDANAQRAKDISMGAISNGVKEAAVQVPLIFGTSKNGENATTRPQVLSVSVVTESKSAINQAATQFLRYGYALNQAYEFETWKCMKNFTYWQVSDIWATGVDTVPEEGQDAVRRMLYQGVTCWTNPDKIGKVSIYDN